MSQWRPPTDKECFYIYVDSKPDETINQEHPDKIFCTAFFSTSSSFKGVKNSDLPWLKEYKDSKSLDESIKIVKKLFIEILNENFFDPYIWIMSSKFSTIDKNGMNFLEGIAKEVDSIKIDNDYIWHKNNRFSLNKAKMLVWYNFCLCQKAVNLVDEVNKWKLPRGTMLIDRLGDSDKRIMDFMQAITFESSMNVLWKRCAEDHKVKPEKIGFEYASMLDEKGKVVPLKNSMQFAVVDWIVHAAYAVNNGIENRDPEFQKELEHLIHTLGRLGIYKSLYFKGEMSWK